MSVNLSGSSSDTHLHPSLTYFLDIGLHCLVIEPNSSVFISFTITTILLLLPLCIFILYHGLQRWRQQCPPSPASHSDSFTYHLATMEIINVTGSIICCYGIFKKNALVLFAWYCLFSLGWYGETCFHVVTCLEHYLAVVHPVIYLSLRNERWIRIRNIITGCIWLLCFGGIVLTAMKVNSNIIDACLVSASVIIISFCSLSVLWALIHPGPGELGRDQRRLTQSKQRAFYTIMVILGALLLRCASNMVWGTLSMMKGGAIECSWIIIAVWCDLPGSLVLPLLFLHRAGKLLCCKNNIN